MTLPQHVVGAVLKPMLRGHVLADDRAGKTPEQIAAARRLPLAVVEVTLAKERAAVAREHAARTKREAEIEDEIRLQRRGLERSRTVW